MGTTAICQAPSGRRLFHMILVMLVCLIPGSQQQLGELLAVQGSHLVRWYGTVYRLLRDLVIFVPVRGAARPLVTPYLNLPT